MRIHLLLCASLACGPTATPIAPSEEVQSEGSSQAEAPEATDTATPDSESQEDMLVEYREHAHPIDVIETPGTREYLQRCRSTLGQDDEEGAFTQCPSVAMRNRDGDTIAVAVDADFRGSPDHLRVYLYSDGQEQELLSEPFSARALNQLARLARQGGWGTMDSVLSHTFVESFSSADVTPFVRLSGMPDNSGLWLEQGDDLDHPTYSLHAVSPDGSAQLIGTREGMLGTNGDWACGEGMCTHDELRALGRLCVLPVNIRRASHRDGVLALQGFVAKTGDRDFPAFHWFVPYPGP